MANFILDASSSHTSTSLESFRECHHKAYAKIFDDSSAALFAVWEEMGVLSSTVHGELNKIESDVAQVWQAAVNTAEQKRDDLHKRIREVESEIRFTTTQLGEDTENTNWPNQSGMTLNERLERFMALRNQCYEMKTHRIAEFTDLLSKINAVQSQFGEGQKYSVDFDDPECKLTRGDLEYYKCEFDSFLAERTRRMMRIESLWRHVKALCSELGQSPTKVAMEVHPSLEFIEQSISGMTLPFSYERLPDLSEASFSLLEEKLKSLMSERSNRENELSHMKETLMSLWDALQMSSDDLDRSILTRSVEGPARLHYKTFEKVKEEIHKQETAKARLLKGLVGKKIEEIQNVCDAGHLPLPKEVQVLMTHCEDAGDASNVGQHADALARLTRMLTHVTLMAEKRSEILTMIRELESARSETDWLTKYERDGNRYKGRDCNRKLQRAIKAGKVRDKLPSMVQKLAEVIMGWEQSENQPFLFDGADYRKEVLETYELHVPQASNPTKTGRQTPSGRKSAIPDMVSPSKSARGATKRRLTPRSNSKSVCFGEGGSMIARPHTSVGPSMRGDFSHLYKNAQTDYHPLQERLDQMLGSDSAMKTLNVENQQANRKSGIPMTPIKSVTQKDSALSEHSLSTDSNRNGSSGDEEMEDVIPVARQSQMSLPPPRLNLNALHKNTSAGQPSSFPNSSQRRPTF